MLQILWLWLTLCSAGTIYLLTLVLHLPFFLTLPAAALASFGWMRFLWPLRTQPANISFPALLIFAAGLFLLVNRGFYLSEKYGQWDAWSIWNLHARFLYFPDGWSNIFAPGVSPHPDYPMNLPLIVAFFWRLTGGQSFLVPFAISSLVTFIIPTLIYFQLAKRNLLVASLLLLWMATDDFFIERGLSGLADSMLALFFLCCFVCADYFHDTRNRRYLVLTGVLLGLCSWTKNEGLLLAGIFSLAYLPVWLREKNLLMIVTGALFPALVWLLFKSVYAPANDLVSRKDKLHIGQLTDPERWNLILTAMKEKLRDYFPKHKLALALYLLAVILRRRLPDRQLLIVAACLGAYLLVYVFTPMDLSWHLNTSLSRLLLQLSPAFIYVVGKQLAAFDKAWIRAWRTKLRHIS